MFICFNISYFVGVYFERLCVVVFVVFVVFLPLVCLRFVPLVCLVHLCCQGPMESSFQKGTSLLHGRPQSRWAHPVQQITGLSRILTRVTQYPPVLAIPVGVRTPDLVVAAPPQRSLHHCT